MPLESDWTPPKICRPENTTPEELERLQGQYNSSLVNLGTTSPKEQYYDIGACEPGSDVCGVKLDNGGQ